MRQAYLFIFYTIMPSTDVIHLNGKVYIYTDTIGVKTLISVFTYLCKDDCFLNEWRKHIESLGRNILCKLILKTFGTIVLQCTRKGCRWWWNWIEYSNQPLSHFTWTTECASTYEKGSGFIIWTYTLFKMHILYIRIFYSFHIRKLQCEDTIMFIA